MQNGLPHSEDHHSAPKKALPVRLPLAAPPLPITLQKKIEYSKRHSPPNPSCPGAGVPGYANTVSLRTGAKRTSPPPPPPKGKTHESERRTVDSSSLLPQLVVERQKPTPSPPPFSASSSIREDYGRHRSPCSLFHRDDSRSLATCTASSLSPAPVHTTSSYARADEFATRLATPAHHDTHACVSGAPSPDTTVTYARVSCPPICLGLVIPTLALLPPLSLKFGHPYALPPFPPWDGYAPKIVAAYALSALGSTAYIAPVPAEEKVAVGVGVTDTWHTHSSGSMASPPAPIESRRGNISTEMHQHVGAWRSAFGLWRWLHGASLSSFESTRTTTGGNQRRRLMHCMHADSSKRNWAQRANAGHCRRQPQKRFAEAE
ncbi:hypothetical protein B0H13DRAFT_2358416 [Mycena leptocephala]|nr:hypothetical protein B0H13DRAFT_2358416 [Mycena leptocephala]